MERALRIQEQLEINKLLCVCDQAIYAKAMEIHLKEPKKFSSDVGEIRHTFDVS